MAVNSFKLTSITVKSMYWYFASFENFAFILLLKGTCVGWYYLLITFTPITSPITSPVRNAIAGTAKPTAGASLLLGSTTCGIVVVTVSVTFLVSVL